MDWLVFTCPGHGRAATQDDCICWRPWVCFRRLLHLAFVPFRTTQKCFSSQRNAELLPVMKKSPATSHFHKKDFRGLPAELGVAAGMWSLIQ